MEKMCIIHAWNKELGLKKTVPEMPKER